MINLHYARTLLNPYLLGEVHLHDVVDAKETLNNFLQKTYGIPNAYALALKDFVNFVKSLSPFYDMPLVKDINLLPHEWWDWGWSMHTCTHHSLYFWCKCVPHHCANEIEVHTHSLVENGHFVIGPCD